MSHHLWHTLTVPVAVWIPNVKCLKMRADNNKVAIEKNKAAEKCMRVIFSVEL